MARKKKQPTHKEKPKDKKTPRGGTRLDQVLGDCVSWHIRILDREGPWGWSDLDKSKLWGCVFQRLSEFEKLTWQEIFRNRKNHPIKKHRLCPKAQQRLSDINQDDTDELISLGVTDISRVWGIQDRNILKVLWWDPDHEVCPSKKSRT